MISSSGWTANTLIPQSIRDLIGTLGAPQPYIDPNALAMRRELIKEGYRTAPELVRRVPTITPAAPVNPISPVPSTPASASLLSKMFGGNPPPASNWGTGNFHIEVPGIKQGTVAPVQANLAGSGWTSPPLDANGFYGLSKTAQAPLNYPERRNPQPF